MAPSAAQNEEALLLVTEKVPEEQDGPHLETQVAEKDATSLRRFTVARVAVISVAILAGFGGVAMTKHGPHILRPSARIELGAFSGAQASNLTRALTSARPVIMECDKMENYRGCTTQGEYTAGTAKNMKECGNVCKSLGRPGCCEWQPDHTRCVFQPDDQKTHHDHGRGAAMCYYQAKYSPGIFDPTSPLTSYTDHAGCGPRGNDAKVDKSVCKYGVEVMEKKSLHHYHVQATVNGCKYFAYKIFGCKGYPRYHDCYNAEGAGTRAGRDEKCQGDLVCARKGFDYRHFGDCKEHHCCSKVR